MADFYTTPNMNLVVPVPTADNGPDWANNINSTFTIVDQHNHTPGSGVLITPSALNINTDLTFNNTNNLIDARSVRFYANVSPLAGASDLGCIYTSGVDLYYNDGNGNQIRITQSGSVTGSAGTISGLPNGTASASYNSSSGTFKFERSTAVRADMDVASLIIRYPGSYPTPSGPYIALQAPSSLASGYALTLPALPAQDFSFMLMNTAGGIFANVNVDNSTIAISSNLIIVKPAGITQNELASNSVGTAQLKSQSVTPAKMSAFNWRVSASTGAFAITNQTSFAQVGSIHTGNITLSGVRPLFLKLVPLINSSNNATGLSIVFGTFGYIQFRDGAGSTIYAQFTIGDSVTLSQTGHQHGPGSYVANGILPVTGTSDLAIANITYSATKTYPINLEYMIPNPGAGTYDFSLWAATEPSTRLGIGFGQLIAYEG